jgi:putative peptide zinc metalloprotease protein
VSEPLFSASWYRVKDLAPRLRPHARVVRHRYRGETWYVLHDPASDRFLRFTPAANQLLALMDGRRNVNEIWKLATEKLGDDAPTQDETIRLLGQLHASDVLQCDISPDAAELFDRWQKRERQERKGRLLSPFAIRLHLFDPERLLARTLPWLRPLFGWGGALLWLAVVVPALFAAATHWGELTENLLDRLFTPTNLVAVWMLFPVLKILHEFGHGYAAKAFGGEVHDMGVMFLVFTPIPYVDASSSLAFPSKWRRATVAAAGMIVEIFLAAMALWIWLAAEPGMVRAIAHNALVIGGVTTLLFNANPLLRFDGYYILSDLIEIPNLGSRANRSVGEWIQRRVFGQREGQPEPMAPGERTWLIGYAVASFVYRILVLAAIVLWIMQLHFLAGVLLGGFAAVGWFGIPAWRAAKHLFTSPQLRRVRGRALGIVGGGAALAALLLALAPVPLRTRAEGVVWLPDEAHVRAGVDGFVGRVVAVPGASVSAGDLLLEMRDPALAAQVKMLEARVREFEARRDAERMRSRVAEQVTLEQLQYARSQLARARERASELRIHSRSAGRFVIPRSEDLVGRFVAQGELLAWVVNFDDVRVRAVVPQGDVDLVRQRTRAVELRLAQRLDSRLPSEVLRIVPAASEQLPSVALGVGGGGELPVDPTAPEGNRAAQSLFEVELAVPADAAVQQYGGRVYVRFDHGTEPLAVQWGRRLRQLFLARFHV